MRAVEHVLAIDQGTTNTKAVLVDGGGRIVARASRPVAAEFPQPGWVEQDPLALWHSVREAVDACLVSHRDLPVAVALTNQRESVVLWERRTGRPLGPAVSWQCRRTAPACETLRARGLEPIVQRKSGLGIDPLFSATKARWLLEQTADGQRRAERGELCLGTIDSWLLWHLTGGEVHATDLTNASRTQLLDLERLTWDPELLEIFGIPAAALATVRPSSTTFGTTMRVGRLAAGSPIAAVIGDSHAALCGQGGFRPGTVKATYGTGSSLMTVTPALVRSARGLSSTIAWARDRPAYALEGNISISGAALDWLAGLLGATDGAAVADLAASVTDTAGVTFVPAFVGLGAPHWDTAARGTIAGITRGTTGAHLARAALEAIAFQVCDVLEVMEADSGTRFDALLVDGGASRSDLLMQLQADLAGRPVVRNLSTDAAAMGAAYLAGLEVGLWPSIQALEALPRTCDRFEPAPGSDRQARHRVWKGAIDKARSDSPKRATAGCGMFHPTHAGWPI